MNKVFIVAESGYEHTQCIKAFGNPEAAQALIDAIKLHDESRPIDDSENENAPDYDPEYKYSPALCEAYNAALDAWNAAGPVEDCRFLRPGGLHIIELEFAP